MFVVNEHFCIFIATYLVQLFPIFSVIVENCFQMSDLPCFAFVK